MRNLSEFQAPTDGEVTLCEVDGCIHSANFEYANVNIFTNSVTSVTLVDYIILASDF